MPPDVPLLAKVVVVLFGLGLIALGLLAARVVVANRRAEPEEGEPRQDDSLGYGTVVVLVGFAAAMIGAGLGVILQPGLFRG